MVNECYSYYNLSANHLNEETKNVTKKWAEEKRTAYVPPEAPILIWDEKKMSKHDRTPAMENRMPVAIAGDERPPQHIGSFLLEDGTGDTVSSTIQAEAANWGVGKDGRPAVMQVWDTCKTNSGWFLPFFFLFFFFLKEEFLSG